MRIAYYRPKRQILSIFGIGVAMLTLLWVLYVTKLLVMVTLIGIGLGVLITPMMRILREKFKIPRAVSALVFILLVLGGIAAITYGLYVLLSDQVQSLADRAPQIISQIQNQVSQVFSQHPWIEGQLRKLEFGKAAGPTFSTLFQGIQTSVSAIIGGVFILTLAIYVAIHSEGYFRGVLSVFPAYLRPKAGHVLQESGRVLRTWFRSQLIVMAISGTVTTLGLWILGIDYWLLLGVLTAVLGFIPYIGSFLTGFATVLVTLGSEPDKIWWVTGLYFAIQQLEGNITIPLIMKGATQLPEAHLIVLMLFMGSLFGILGVFIAPPLLAVSRTIYLMTYVPHMNQKLSPEGISQHDI